MFSDSEKKIIAKIRREVQRNKDYMFWFVYCKDCKTAIDYEGGYELPTKTRFRNTYTLPAGLYKRIVKTKIGE